MKLSVLAQSPVISGLAARRAIEETLLLAPRIEALGYHRYWLAEHHAIAALADPCPEILVSRVASATSRLRVGPGGVLIVEVGSGQADSVEKMMVADGGLAAAGRFRDLGGIERAIELTLPA